MIENEIAAFLRCLDQYFTQSLAHTPQIGTPYLVETRSRIGKDYTGIIGVSGKRTGLIYFTAPRGLLSVLLMALGETEISHENMRDLVGEVANTISGNVRRDFGRDFRIAVPEVVTGEPELENRPPIARSIMIPVHVRNYEARLVIALQ